MKSSIQYVALQEEKSDERERVKLTNDLRRVAVQTYRGLFTATTTNAAPTATIWTSEDMPKNSTWEVFVSVQLASLAVPAGYQRVGRFGRATTTSFALGAIHTPIPDDEFDPSADVSLSNFGNGVRLTVTGAAGAGNAAWSAFVEIREARL